MTSWSTLTSHWYNINCCAKFDNNENSVMVCHAQNVDERKEYERKLRYLSTHDQLTGIYNRTFFDASLESIYDQERFPLSVLVFDIDNFKLINDSYGHAQGDRIIMFFVNAIKVSLRDGDYLARIGGDEFAAVLPSTDEKTSKKLMEKILKGISELKHTQEDMSVDISLSMDSAMALNKDISTENLLRIPDESMYKHKKAKKQ